MRLSFRPFTSNDIETCQRWAKAIEFQQYQSRFTPRSYNAGDGSYNAELCAWYIIVVDGEDAGTVWLEKEAPGDDVAVLGIMLGQPDRFGKGIGREAIRQAVRQARGWLGFRAVLLNVRAGNTRAIAYYRRCGFVTVGEGVKTGQDGEVLPYLVMRLDLDESAARIIGVKPE